jgi:xylose isomerase
MRAAKAAGLSAIRLWGHGDGVQTLLQTDAGVYDEQVFRSLDYVVHQARLHNIRVRTLHMAAVDGCPVRVMNALWCNESSIAAGSL